MIKHKLLIFPTKYHFEVRIFLSGLRKFRVLVQNAIMMTRKNHKHMVKKYRVTDNYLKMQSCNLDIHKKIKIYAEKLLYDFQMGHGKKYACTLCINVHLTFVRVFAEGLILTG